MKSYKLITVKHQLKYDTGSLNMALKKSIINA